jgi:hypothetical protein
LAVFPIFLHFHLILAGKSNLQTGISVSLPRALDGAPNAITSSELLFLNVEVL